MNSILLAFSLGWGEIVLILVVILLLFGAKRLPELARGLGQGIKEFKRATRDIQDDLHRAIEEEPRREDPPRQVNTPKVAASETTSSGSSHPAS